MTASSAPILATDAIFAIAAAALAVAALLVHRALRSRRPADAKPASVSAEVPGPKATPNTPSTTASTTTTTTTSTPATPSPTQPVPGDASAGPARSGPVAVAPRPAGPVEALLAEDNDVNAIILTRLLERLGCRVTRANNGAEAVAAVRAHRFEILFMDWRMPEMDGLEAIRHIRRIEDGAHLPIVAVTANALPGDRETCLAAGADDYLTKPIDASLLRAALLRFVPEAGAPAAPATASERAAR